MAGESPPPHFNRLGKEAAIAQKEEKVEMTGEIVEALRNGMFRISLDNGHQTLGYTAGKMRRFRIRMNPGDRFLPARACCESSVYSIWAPLR